MHLVGNLICVVVVLAPTFKLIGNSIILGCIEIMAEGQTLAEKTGIGADAVQGLIKGQHLYTFISHHELTIDYYLALRIAPCSSVRTSACWLG